MDDTDLLRVPQPPRDIEGHLRGFSLFQGALPFDALLQRFAIDELHGEVVVALGRLAGVQGRHDVGVLEFRGGPGFPQETVHKGPAAGQPRRKHLEGHGAVHRGLVCLEDDAHPASAELGLELVSRDFLDGS